LKGTDSHTYFEGDPVLEEDGYEDVPVNEEDVAYFEELANQQ